MTTTLGRRGSVTPSRGRASRSRRLSTLQTVLLGTASVLALLGLWQTASAFGWIPASAIPSASDVLAALGASLTSPDFWTAVGKTVTSTAIGLGLVIVIATPLSLLIGLSRFARESLLVPLEFLKPVPPVALIPLTLLLWGPSPSMQIFLIVFGAVWPLLTQMTYGVREVSGVAMQMARSYRLGWWLTTSRVVVPSLLPFAATGLRVSAAIALIVAIVTEMVAGVPGLGQLITLSQLAGRLPEMYAAILAAGLLGLALNALLRLGERGALFWHSSQREARS